MRKNLPENADKRARLMMVSGPIASCVAGAAHAGAIKTVFVIAMENHNWTQPASQTSPGQIFGNTAVPYVNSLVAPGNSNAAQVSYASDYLNAGPGIHPSEPNYIWAEAGSNLGITNDADPYQQRIQPIQQSQQLSATRWQDMAVLPRGHRRKPDQQSAFAHEPVHCSAY